MPQPEKEEPFHDPLEALDRDRIQNWVTQFATLLEMPELWDDIAGWL